MCWISALVLPRPHPSPRCRFPSYTYGLCRGPGGLPSETKTNRFQRRCKGCTRLGPVRCEVLNLVGKLWSQSMASFALLSRISVAVRLRRRRPQLRDDARVRRDDWMILGLTKGLDGEGIDWSTSLHPHQLKCNKSNANMHIPSSTSRSWHEKWDQCPCTCPRPIRGAHGGNARRWRHLQRVR